MGEITLEIGHGAWRKPQGSIESGVVRTVRKIGECCALQAMFDDGRGNARENNYVRGGDGAKTVAGLWHASARSAKRRWMDGGG